MRKYTRKTSPGDLYPLIPVRQLVKALQYPHNIKISYTGLMRYRNLELISPPQKIKGYKERFYNVNEVANRIDSVNLTSAIFKRNFSEIAKLVKKLPSDTFDKFPVAFMKIYSDTVLPRKREEWIKLKKGKYLSPLKPFVFMMARQAFWNAAEMLSAKAENVSAEDFYFGIVKPKFIRTMKFLPKGIGEFVRQVRKMDKKELIRLVQKMKKKS